MPRQLIRRYIKPEENPLDDLTDLYLSSSTDSRYNTLRVDNGLSITDNKTINHTKDGDKYVMKEYELKDVLRDMLDDVISNKNIDLYRETENKIESFVVNQNAQLLNNFNRAYENKLNDLSEKIFNRLLEFEIEKEVNRRLSDKLEEIIKIIKK